MLERQKAWNKFKQRKTYGTSLKYTQLRNIVCNEIHKAKAVFEESLAERTKDNRKCFYSYVNKKNTKSSLIGPLINDSNAEVLDVLNELNEYFASVFTIETNFNIPEVKNNKVTDQSLQIEEMLVNEEVVSNVIKSLKPNKSPGEDEINSTYLIMMNKYIPKTFYNAVQ